LLAPAVQFLALAELTLSTIWFSDDDGPRLGHLLSCPSCCPRLRKLKLSNLHGLHDLRLDGVSLETLYLAQLNVRRLDVDAPRLSALTVDSYFMFYRYPEHSSITVRAPALEKLDATLTLGYIQLELQRHTIHLLQQCRPIHGHLLRLHVPEVCTFYIVSFSIFFAAKYNISLKFPKKLIFPSHRIYQKGKKMKR
jgi:hypothetical protein